MLEIGTVVRSIAGHDKLRYYVVVESLSDKVMIVDGKVRKLAKPKAKNLKHVAATHIKISLDEITSDKALRRILEPMNQSLNEKTTGGGN